MTDFWFAVFLSLVFCTGYLYISVCYDSTQAASKDFREQLKTSRWLLVLPAIFLLTSPLIYLNRPGYAKQQALHAVIQNAQSFFEPPVASNKTAIAAKNISSQELLLVLRSKAFQQPDNGRLWFEMGQVYTRLNMNKSALLSFERALRLENNPEWAVATAQLLSRTQAEPDLQKAKHYLQQVLTRVPTHANALFLLGSIHSALGEDVKAIDVWQKLAALPGLSSASKLFVQNKISDEKQKIEDINRK